MTGVSTSCGACKFLRRKCTSECVFAPYYSYDEAVTNFGAVHKVFGASNVSRLLHHLPEPYRGEAALTISFEAVARMRDPVYGCVAYIYTLQQEVANLQEEIKVVGNQIMANNLSLGVATSDIFVASQSTNNSHNVNNNNDIMINNNESSLTWSSQQDQIVDQIMVDVVPDQYWISNSSSNSVVVPQTLDVDENGSCSSQMMMMMMMKMSNHMMMNDLQDYYSSCLWQGHHLFGITADTTGTGPHLLNQDTFDYSFLFASLPDITT